MSDTPIPARVEPVRHPLADEWRREAEWRGRSAPLVHNHSYVTGDRMAAELDRLAGENERLRGALQMIAEIDGASPTEPGGACGRVARANLKEPADG